MKAREKRLAWATGLFVGGVALWAFALEPALRSWGELGEREDVLRQALDRDRSLAARLPELEDRREALGAALQPPEDEGVVPWFVAFVRDLTRGAGFQPRGLRYVRSEVLRADGDESPFAELRFELRASVELPELRAFLVALAASPRPVRVVSLGVNPLQGGDALEVDLSLAALAPRDAIDREGGP